MTISKMYYLATILGKLNSLSSILLFISFVATVIILVWLICVILDRNPKEDIDFIKKIVKTSIIILSISLLFKIITPSKEDFLIIAMTKDYKPEQVYQMTKDEIKNSIDYLFKQIKEIKEWTKEELI